MMRLRPRVSVFFVVGGIALIVGELLHPEPPTDPAAILAMIAANDHWGFCHFVQAAGALLLALGFVDRSITGASGSNSRLRLFAISGASIAVAALTIDGDAFKYIADAWAAAPHADALMLAAAFRENALLEGAMIAAAMILLFGFSPLLAGIAIAHRQRGKLPGRVGIGLGAAAIVLGTATMIHTPPLPPLPWYPLITLAVAVWSIWVGVFLWRHPSGGDHDGNHLRVEEIHSSWQYAPGRLRSPLDVTKL